MKRKITALILVLALTVSLGGIFTSYAEEDPEVSVVVNDDGSVTVTATGTFVKNDWVGIYFEDEEYDPNSGGVTSLVWWYLPEGEDQTVSVTYPGNNEGINIDTSNRPGELSNGNGSALVEGSYYAMILGGEDSTTAYEPRSEAFNFEISAGQSDSTEAPTETPAETPAAETPDEATATPEATEKATEAPENTAKATATAKVTVTPAQQTSSAGETSGSDTVLWIIIAVAAVVIVAAVVAIFVIKSKKKK